MHEQRVTHGHGTGLRLDVHGEPRESFSDPNIYVSLNGGAVSSLYIKNDDLGICCMEGLPTSPFYWVGSRELLHELLGR